MKRSIFARLMPAMLFVVVAAGSSTAFAQATRTWISGVGDDVNPCSRTAPCKTWAGAISKTADGGEINAIDSGGFGSVTITKSITLDGMATMASILAPGTNGIVINAAATAIVILRNIEINGAGAGSAGDRATGISGIKFISGAALHVDNVNVYGFSRGIDFQPTGNAELYVGNSVIQRNFRSGIVGNGGIIAIPGISGSAYVTLDNVRLERNNFGLRAEARSNVVIRNSVISGNLSNGVLAVSTGTAAKVAIDSSTVSSNGSDASAGGIKSEGAGGLVRISNNLITDNTNGLLMASGGKIISYGDNRVDGNAVDGTPFQTISTR